MIVLVADYHSFCQELDEAFGTPTCLKTKYCNELLLSSARYLAESAGLIAKKSLFDSINKEPAIQPALLFKYEKA